MHILAPVTIKTEDTSMVKYIVRLTGQIITPPDNVVQRLGEPSRFVCDANVGSDTLEWKEYITNDTMGRLLYSTADDRVRDNRYDVIRTPRGYDLLLMDTIPQLTGTYECGLVQANETHQANLLGVCMYFTSNI